MLEVCALTKRYFGSAAVREISFVAAPGDVLGLLGPNGSGLAHLAYGLGVVAVSVELLFLRRRKIPFTCAYMPGRANLRLAWPLYLLAFFGAVGGALGLERWMLQEPARLLLLAAGGLAVSAWCRIHRGDARVGEDTPVFDEEQDPWLSLKLDC